MPKTSISVFNSIKPDYLIYYLFSFVMFLSSFLMFTIEPMQAKDLLMILGGTPTVWTGCMVFYQITLLIGYIYAHYLSKAPMKLQLIIHATLIVIVILSLTNLNISKENFYNPSSNQNPIYWLIYILALNLGPVFFILSTTTPLLQSWFYKSNNQKTNNPYPLFAVGNAGGLIGIITYPTIVEPFLKLTEQKLIWNAGYLILNICVLAVALWLWIKFKFKKNDLANLQTLPTKKTLKLTIFKLSFSKHHLAQRLYWIVLSFVPSSLLLGVTSYLTNDIAPIPLLWAAPLFLYMLSFVIVFTNWRTKYDNITSYLLPLLILSLGITLITPMWITISLHLFYFFAATLTCHGRLALFKPQPDRLTEFYFFISLGGVCGSIFNALLAPQIFNQLAEYPIMILAALIICMPVSKTENSISRFKTIGFTSLTIFLLVAVYSLIVKGGYEYKFFIIDSNVINYLLKDSIFFIFGSLIYFLISVLLFCYFIFRPQMSFAYFNGLCIGVFVLMFFYQKNFRHIIHQERSFFGTLTVVNKANSMHTLKNGTIVHGEQQMNTLVSRSEPLAYYHKTGPLGQIWETLEARVDKPKIAAVGLGVGAIAAYGTPNNYITFYELNPYMERLARNPELFTYINDCLERGCNLDVIIGDGRLQLSKAKENYDLIILDAFNSDAIPIHLLTLEAIELYLSKLKRDGILAVHISNRYINLEPILLNVSKNLGLNSFIRKDKKTKNYKKRPSKWVVISNGELKIKSLSDQSILWKPLESNANSSLWTDDYANVFEALTIF